MNESHPFRCGPAARWLPRTLAGSALVSAMILSARIHAGVEGSIWSHSRTLVVLVGAVSALLIVRGGAMVRAELRLTGESLRLALGKHRRELPFDQVVTMTYETPLVQMREWLPAMVLIDRFGRRWRIPALLVEGERFVAELLRAAGREDLRSLASAHRLSGRMAATRGRLLWGYGVAFGLIVATALFTFLGAPR